MTLDSFEILALGAAVLALLMLGTTHLRMNLGFYALHTLLLAANSFWVTGFISAEHAYLEPICFGLFKGVGVPLFLNWIAKRINIESDNGTFLAAPLAMHLSILLLGASYLLSANLPGITVSGDTRIGATAAMSLLFTGVLLMLTRKLAISQIIGFLVMENGIYLFALTQTRGMPMIVAMGVLLDVLVGVMVAGLILFDIKKSFEHIDVTQLTELKD